MPGTKPVVELGMSAKQVDVAIRKLGYALITTNHRPITKVLPPLTEDTRYAIMREIGKADRFKNYFGMFKIPQIQEDKTTEILVGVKRPTTGRPKLFGLVKPSPILISDYYPKTELKIPVWIFGYRYRFQGIGDQGAADPELRVLFVVNEDVGDGIVSAQGRTFEVLHALIAADRDYLQNNDPFTEHLSAHFRLVSPMTIFMVNAALPDPAAGPVYKFISKQTVTWGI